MFHVLCAGMEAHIVILDILLQFIQFFFLILRAVSCKFEASFFCGISSTLGMSGKRIHSQSQT